MYKISSELLIKVTKAIDNIENKYIANFMNDGEETSFEKALIKLVAVKNEIKEKYDLTGYKK